MTPANVSSVLFQDAMDMTRFLQIKEERRDTVVCKVFFGPDKKRLTYYGTAIMSKRLFYFDGTGRYGYNPAREPEDPKIKAIREAAMLERRRGNREDRDDDFR